MSNQVQCPNCGGYKVNVQNKTVIATEEKKQYTSFGGQLVAWFAIGIFVLWATISAISISVSIVGEGSGVIIGVSCGVILILFLAFVRYRAVKKGTADWHLEKVPSIVKYDYRCEICGYNWTWQSDEPLPEVHVRPELIAKGAQKLKEEDEARRQAEIAHHVAQDILNRKP